MGGGGRSALFRVLRMRAGQNSLVSHNIKLNQSHDLTNIYLSLLTNYENELNKVPLMH
jgi:hypothetical protein